MTIIIMIIISIGKQGEETKAEETTKPAAKDANAPRFEIKKWNAVAMWSWDICIDTVRGENNNNPSPSIHQV